MKSKSRVGRRYRMMYNGEETPDPAGLDYITAGKQLRERMDSIPEFNSIYSRDMYLLADIADTAEYFADKLVYTDFAIEKLIEARNLLREAIKELGKMEKENE